VAASSVQNRSILPDELHSEIARSESTTRLRSNVIGMQVFQTAGISGVYAGMEVAVKSARDLRERASLANEVSVLRALGWHPRIIPLFDVIESENKPGSPVEHLVLPLCTRGSLRGLLDGLRKSNPCKPPMHDILGIVSLFVDCLSGLRHVHEQGFVHGDLKEDNILLDAEGRAVLADFGITCVEGTERVATGTLPYLAPEV
jgi:serine/threonine protein kinase